MPVPFAMAPRLKIAGFVALLATLLFLYFRPTPPPDVFTRSDLWMHFVAVAAVTAAAFIAFPGANRWRIGGVCLLVAASLEPLQGALQPTRRLEWMDFGANFAGVALVVLVVLIRGAAAARSREQSDSPPP